MPRPFPLLPVKGSLLDLCAPRAAFLEWMIGEDDARIVETSFVVNTCGEVFERIEIRLAGTVGGWTVREVEPHHNNLTDAPDLIFPQLGVRGEPVPGFARYAGSHGMTLFLPRDADEWNRGLIVTAHGGSSYGIAGVLPPFPGAFRHLANANKFVGTFIDKGFAVAHTMRSSAIAVDLGDLPVVFAGGEEGAGFHVGTHAGLMVRWAELARNIVEQSLSQRVTRTLFYGFSSGGMQARILNYVPHTNRDSNEKRFFDGIIVDDCGGGVPLAPHDFAPDIATFAPHIEITHAAYDAPVGPRVLDNKRKNAGALAASVAGPGTRHFEVPGVSHFDAGYGPEDQGRGRDAIAQNIDLSAFLSAVVDLLDAWVVHGTPPPPSCVVELPEVAAPLGRYFPYPPELGGARVGLQTTGFAAYDGINLEPLDGLGGLVDMNGSGTREVRETLTAAWLRLGLIDEGVVDRSRYLSRVREVVERLAHEGLIDAASVPGYIERAERIPFPQSE